MNRVLGLLLSYNTITLLAIAAIAVECASVMGPRERVAKRGYGYMPLLACALLLSIEPLTVPVHTFHGRAAAEGWVPALLGYSIASRSDFGVLFGEVVIVLNGLFLAFKWARMDPRSKLQRVVEASAAVVGTAALVARCEVSRAYDLTMRLALSSPGDLGQFEAGMDWSAQTMRWCVPLAAATAMLVMGVRTMDARSSANAQ